MRKLIDNCEIVFSDDGGEVSPEIAGRINEVVQPIRLVEPSDIYVRAMYITSDRLNHQGGKFGAAEIEKLCCLIPGAPVLVGHDKRRLPIARCFKADLVDRDGEKWVKVWFYWLRATEGAHDLLRNIDGGIYAECSLGFSFTTPECSICGGDIRNCSHIPGRKYRGESSQNELCHYVYRGITRVNEISLVYRGAVPGTAIAEKDLFGGDHQDRSHCFSIRAFGRSGIVLDMIFGGFVNCRIVFPQYSKKLLRDGKIMVGHVVYDTEAPEDVEPVDSGSINILESSDDGIRFKSEGECLNGEYTLRSAILQGEKTVLLYRVVNRDK